MGGEYEETGRRDEPKPDGEEMVGRR